MIYYTCQHTVYGIYPVDDAVVPVEAAPFLSCGTSAAAVVAWGTSDVTSDGKRSSVSTTAKADLMSSDSMA